MIDARSAERLTPEQLRELVKSTGLSQREIAARLGVTRKTLMRWMGTTTPVVQIPYTAQFALLEMANG